MLTKLLKRAQNGRSKTIFLDTTLDEGTAYANEIIFVIEKKSRQQSVKVYLAPFLSSVMYRWKVLLGRSYQAKSVTTRKWMISPIWKTAYICLQLTTQPWSSSPTVQLTDLQYPFECPASSSQMSTSSLPPISSLKPLGAQVSTLHRLQRHDDIDRRVTRSFEARNNSPRPSSTCLLRSWFRFFPTWTYTTQLPYQQAANTSSVSSLSQPSLETFCSRNSLTWHL